MAASSPISSGRMVCPMRSTRRKVFTAPRPPRRTSPARRRWCGAPIRKPPRRDSRLLDQQRRSIWNAGRRTMTPARACWCCPIRRRRPHPFRRRRRAQPGAPTLTPQPTATARPIVLATPHRPRPGRQAAQPTTAGNWIGLIMIGLALAIGAGAGFSGDAPRAIGAPTRSVSGGPRHPIDPPAPTAAIAFRRRCQLLPAMRPAQSRNPPDSAHAVSARCGPSANSAASAVAPPDRRVERVARNSIVTQPKPGALEGYARI